jgi:hypothetical protein
MQALAVDHADPQQVRAQYRQFREWKGSEDFIRKRGAAGQNFSILNGLPGSGQGWSVLVTLPSLAAARMVVAAVAALLATDKLEPQEHRFQRHLAMSVTGHSGAFAWLR